MEVISRRGCVVRLVKLQTSVGVGTRAILSLTRLIDLDLIEGQEQLLKPFKNLFVFEYQNLGLRMNIII